MEFNIMLKYANDYNHNYVGTEGDMDKGAWSDGRLAYSTLSKGYSGGYNIYLNPDLDRESVSQRLSKQLNVEISPDELYIFLFFHEIGHTEKAGNESYITAMVNTPYQGEGGLHAEGVSLKLCIEGQKSILIILLLNNLLK
jgi:hypothetical protein